MQVWAGIQTPVSQSHLQHPLPKGRRQRGPAGRRAGPRGYPQHPIPALELSCVHPAGLQPLTVICSSPQQHWGGEKGGREGGGQAGLCGKGVFPQLSSSQFLSCLCKAWLLSLWEALLGGRREPLTPSHQPWLGSSPRSGGSPHLRWAGPDAAGEPQQGKVPSPAHSSKQRTGDNRGTWAEAPVALRPRSIPWVPKPREPQCAAASCPQVTQGALSPPMPSLLLCG